MMRLFIGGAADGRTFDVSEDCMSCDFPYNVGNSIRVAHYVFDGEIFKHVYG